MAGDVDFMFSFKNSFYLQVDKVNCRLANIGVSILRGIIVILTFTFPIIKNKSIEEFNYQYELKEQKKSTCVK